MSRLARRAAGLSVVLLSLAIVAVLGMQATGIGLVASPTPVPATATPQASEPAASQDLLATFDEIERTTLQSVAISEDGSAGTETAAQVVDHFGELNDAGAQHVIFNVRNVHDPGVLELIGRDVIPQLRPL